VILVEERGGTGGGGSHEDAPAGAPRASPAERVGTRRGAAERQRGLPAAGHAPHGRGLRGRKDLPPIHKSHPQTTPDAVVERILAVSVAHPAWGCCRLEAHLKLDGVSVSSPTIQAILSKHELGTS
jgi:hypothetical protein